MSTQQPVINITVNPKFIKMGLDVQLRDVAHQIAMLLYGLKYTYGVNGALGSRQQIKTTKNHLKDNRYIVILPDMHQPISSSTGTGATCTGTLTLAYTRNSTEIIKDIKNMISHGQSCGVAISINLHP
jgi:hypothetical protein